MARSTHDGDLQITGTLSVGGGFSPPAVSIRNVSIAADAAIEASKLQRGLVFTYAQDSTTVATVERRVLHRMRAAGTLVDFRVGSVTIATGTGNAVFDLLKNGSTVLSGTITLDSANTNYLPEQASGFTSTTLAANDVLEFKVTSAAVGSGAKPIGVFCELVIDGTYA